MCEWNFSECKVKKKIYERCCVYVFADKTRLFMLVVWHHTARDISWVISIIYVAWMLISSKLKEGKILELEFFEMASPIIFYILFFTAVFRQWKMLLIKLLSYPIPLFRLCVAECLLIRKVTIEFLNLYRLLCLNWLIYV